MRPQKRSICRQTNWLVITVLFIAVCGSSAAEDAVTQEAGLGRETNSADSSAAFVRGGQSDRGRDQATVEDSDLVKEASDDDSEHQSPHESLDMARQGVDDWSPSQVAHWLQKEGIGPWHERDYLSALEEHDLDGHLLLSLHPRDILLTLEPEMQQLRPADFSRHLQKLSEKLAELREAIAQNPVDFWEYQVAHRRSAALIFCGLALAPRVTILYMLGWARQPLFLVVGHRGLTLLSLVLVLFAPNLAVSLHLSHVIKHNRALVATLAASHACIFLGVVASTRGAALDNIVTEALRTDVYRAVALAAAHVVFNAASWWLVDVTVYVVMLTQIAYSVLMLALWVTVVRQIAADMRQRSVLRPVSRATAGGGGTRNRQSRTGASTARAPRQFVSTQPPAGYKRL
jgi:hypothetical protein